MDVTLQVPVFVRERETGRMLLLSSVQDVRAYAEEFADIPDDFDFWDAKGYTLVMSSEFIDGLSAAPAVGRCDVRGLVRAVEDFVRSRQADRATASQLVTTLGALGHIPDK